MQIKYNKTKTLVTRDNGRSSDAISPNFVYGCLGGCMSSYCYVGRYNNNKLYINTNTDDILQSINSWALDKPMPKIPNQVDDKYYCIDIGCSTDVALHKKYYDWQKVFDFFNEHPKLKSTFATKYPSMFKDYNLNKEKHRIRISSISRLQDLMEVHINFSPIIWHEGWLSYYRNLFEKLNRLEFKSECIFLTYNNIQQQRNSDEVNSLCFKPDFQEIKNSQYADNNIRYKWQLKNDMINEFKELYSAFFPLETIRYIF
jgi:spore photoproduct lyase